MTFICTNNPHQSLLISHCYISSDCNKGLVFGLSLRDGGLPQMAHVPSGWLRMRFSCLLGLLNVSGTGFNGVLDNGWLQVCVPACVRVFSRACLECVCSYSVLPCWQEESEEEAVFVIFPCCHGHGAFWCCHHQRNYMQRLTTVILLTACVSLKSPYQENNCQSCASIILTGSWGGSPWEVCYNLMSLWRNLGKRKGKNLCYGLEVLSFSFLSCPIKLQSLISTLSTEGGLLLHNSLFVSHKIPSAVLCDRRLHFTAGIIISNLREGDSGS